jgi:hypothetical protein
MEIAIISMTKKFFYDEQFENEVFPTFLRIFETEADESTDVSFSNMIGRFIHFLPGERFRSDQAYVKVYIHLIKRYINSSSETFPQVKENLAYNLPCLYKYFGKYEQGGSFRTLTMSTFTAGLQQGSPESDTLDFGAIAIHLLGPEQTDSTKVTMGKALHELIKEAEAKSRNPFVF